MREYKFRGKSLSNGEWVYGFYTQGLWFDPETNKHNVRHLISNEELHDVDPDTIGQYTGLKDKNGRDIYEGDIVKNGEFVYLVVYEGNRFASFGLERKVDMFMHFFGEALEANECEIIGNIHDNPSILEEK